MKKLIKFGTGIATAASLLYWTAVPALAITLCPSADGGGTNFSVLCTNPTTPEDLVSTAINVLLFVAFVAALVFLIIGGIRWILSGGDKEGTAKAKSTVTSALIGLVIVLAAWILLNVVVKFFNLGDINKMTLPHLPSGSGSGTVDCANHPSDPACRQ